MKSFKKLLFVLPFLFLLTGCSNNPEAEQAKSLKDVASTGFVTIDSNNIDLKEIPIRGGKVDVYYTFRNAGDEPVVLMEGTTTCMCTEAVIKGNNDITSPRIVMPGHGAIAQINQVLEPNEEAQLIATYDPLAHGPNGTGSIMREIIIKTNSVKTPEIKFIFQGNVIP